MCFNLQTSVFVNKPGSDEELAILPLRTVKILFYGTSAVKRCPNRMDLVKLEMSVILIFNTLFPGRSNP